MLFVIRRRRRRATCMSGACRGAFAAVLSNFVAMVCHRLQSTICNCVTKPRVRARRLSKTALTATCTVLWPSRKICVFILLPARRYGIGLPRHMLWRSVCVCPSVCQKRHVQRECKIIEIRDF